MHNQNDRCEKWLDMNGDEITVVDVRRTLTTEDTCPECSGGIRYAEGIVDGKAVFRIECTACMWRTEALPDPQA